MKYPINRLFGGGGSLKRSSVGFTPIVGLGNVRQKSNTRSVLPRLTTGFTLIELLVVIAVIGLLAAVIMASLSTARKKARDARRLEDMRQVQTALAMYFTKYGYYPPVSPGTNMALGDTPADGTFIQALVDEGFLPQTITDPSIPTNYMYYHYVAGEYGCPTNRGKFFFLEITDLETYSRPATISPGWQCSGRNWTAQFDWVTGGYEN